MIVKKSKGSILVVTLLFLSVLAFMTQQLFKSVMVGYVFDKSMVSRAQAQSLALGGINLAISQLTFKDEDKQGSDTAQRQLTEEDKTKKYKSWLQKLISNLNRWQVFELSDELDGIDGKIKLCVSSENGKININHAFDFEKKQFKKEYDFLLKGLEIKGKMKPGEIYEKMTEYFKERNRKLDDVTELFNIENFNKLDIFYEPPLSLDYSEQNHLVQNKKSFSNQRIALQDLFTVFTSDYKMQPMLFSDSMCAVLGIRRPHSDDIRKKEENFKKVLENFKSDWGKNWDENWRFLLPIYEKKPKYLKSIKDILSQEFVAKVYSVVSCGIVNKVEQRVLAILKEVLVSDKSGDKDKNSKTSNASSGGKTQDKSSDKKKETRSFRIVKIYWL